MDRITAKSIANILDSLGNFRSAKAELEERASKTEEKYRKLMEEETAEIRGSLARVTEEEGLWKDLLARYDAADVDEVRRERGEDAVTVTEVTENEAVTEEPEYEEDETADGTAEEEEDTMEAHAEAHAEDDEGWPDVVESGEWV